jgi:hypothetical protein
MSSSKATGNRQDTSGVQGSGSRKKGDFKSFLYGTLSGLICGGIYQPLEVLKINMIILPDDLFTNKIMRDSTYYG